MFMITVWWIHGWAEEEFVNRTEFGELKGIIVEHVDDMNIVNASQYIRDKELALKICEATGSSEKEIDDIRKLIRQANKYRTCLINEEPNCKHLKPPE